MIVELLGGAGLGAAIGAGIDAARGRDPVDGLKTGAFVGAGVTAAGILLVSILAASLGVRPPTSTGGV